MRVAVLLQPVASATGRGMAVVQVAETLEIRETLARKLLLAGAEPRRLHGLERDADRVDAARRRATGVAVVEGDDRALPYRDGRFGAVFLVTVLSSLDRSDVPAAIRGDVTGDWPGV